LLCIIYTTITDNLHRRLFDAILSRLFLEASKPEVDPGTGLVNQYHTLLRVEVEFLKDVLRGHDHVVEAPVRRICSVNDPKGRSDGVDGSLEYSVHGRHGGSKAVGCGEQPTQTTHNTCQLLQGKMKVTDDPPEVVIVIVIA
jgi:hypothetical protein